MDKTVKDAVRATIAYYMVMDSRERYEGLRAIETNLKRPRNWSPHNGITREEYVEASRVFLYIINWRDDIIEYLDAMVFNARLRVKKREEYEAFKARVKANKN